MKFLNVREFAEHLRIEGNEWAEQILEALDWKDSVNELAELKEEIEYRAPDDLKDLHNGYLRIIERYRDSHDLLDELRETLDANGFAGVDIDDALAELLTDRVVSEPEYDL